MENIYKSPYIEKELPSFKDICTCFIYVSAFALLNQGVEGIKLFGIENLIRTAASQLSDQLPESREAARTLLLELQNVYQKSVDLSPVETVVSEELTEPSSWENFCQEKLSPLSAQAVLRVTNVSREGLVLGS